MNEPEHNEIWRKLDSVEQEIQKNYDLLKSTSKRVSILELLIAEARGMKNGVIAAFSLIWAVSVAALAAAWKWLSK